MTGLFPRNRTNDLLECSELSLLFYASLLHSPRRESSLKVAMTPMSRLARVAFMNMYAMAFTTGNGFILQWLPHPMASLPIVEEIRLQVMVQVSISSSRSPFNTDLKEIEL